MKNSAKKVLSNKRGFSAGQIIIAVAVVAIVIAVVASLFSYNGKSGERDVKQKCQNIYYAATSAITELNATGAQIVWNKSDIGIPGTFCYETMKQLGGGYDVNDINIFAGSSAVGYIYYTNGDYVCTFVDNNFEVSKVSK